MRLVFAGTPSTAVPSLEALVDDGHEIAAVLTRDDAKVGRSRALTPSPVAARAAELGLRVIKSNRMSPDVTAELASLDAELGVIVAYGALIDAATLDAPERGWINLHFSLLPDLRGAAPAQRAVMRGDSSTGMTIFQLTVGLDEGPVFATQASPIGETETSGELLERLAGEGAAFLAETVQGISEDALSAKPQVGEPTTAAKLRKQDSAVDWAAPLVSVDAHIRGVTPEPGAVAHVDGQPLRILRTSRPSEAIDAPPLAPGQLAVVGQDVLVGTGTQPLQLLTVQPAGKKPMPARDWLRGRRDAETLVLA
ncbi:methionyl-tRNA formyltransferase [Pseudoclavibacter sp. VKM Ac-2867]|uniref:methionyl-tRNA formyltransferase n=1 Tax=Pseudoclavibacter sp. VKM Ac-2867 TaxID=2783829 RepID=UPI00188A6E92|nr:methionyl-tRNA formyltransferase [Pseudoclavibacter sp. VKM Ac-2867]MBF4459319.1 methionyl-tRNA formyltransferase [Pseudoclavibacter sp. VKM Ac-2867]